MTNFYLIRHGVTVWNAQGRLQGSRNIPLSSEGKRQAELVGLRLRDSKVQAVYSSDLRRAYDTAQCIARHHGLTVEGDRRLRERALGVWEGLTRDEIALMYPNLQRRSRKEPGVRIPGGELLSEVRSRALEFLQDVMTEKPEQTIAVVSHGGTLSQVLAAILGIDQFRGTLRLANCGITKISASLVKGQPNFVIIGINDFSHLEDMGISDFDAS